MTSAEELKQEILKKRSCGICHFDFRGTLDIGERVDDSIRRYVALLGFQPEGHDWYVEIDRDHAIRILIEILHKDMAYSAEIMSLQDAQKLADRFVNLFGTNCHFFSNSEWKGFPPKETNQTSLEAWTGITKASFDSGVFAISNTAQGCFWVEDED